MVEKKYTKFPIWICDMNRISYTADWNASKSTQIVLRRATLRDWISAVRRNLIKSRPTLDSWRSNSLISAEFYGPGVDYGCLWCRRSWSNFVKIHMHHPNNLTLHNFTKSWRPHNRTHEKLSKEHSQLAEYPQTFPINGVFGPRAMIFSVS